MTDTSNIYRILDGSPLALAAGAADGWDGYEQIAAVGAYKGHWQGAFEITEAMLQQMADFGNSKNIETPADYGHALIYDSSADASGWVKPGDFEVRGTGKGAALFAKVSWTERARAKIAAKEIKYKSPTIIFNTPDRKTGRPGGASLHSLALTNTPFLHELPEVRLNSIMGAINSLNNPGAELGEEKNMDGLTNILGLAEGAAEKNIESAVKALQDRASKMEQIYADLANAIDGADKLTALAELKAKAASADAANERLTAMEAAEAARAVEAKDAAALSAVKAAQAEGKILGDDTEHYRQHLALAQQDLERFTALAAVMPKIAPVVAAPVHRADADDMDETARTVNAALGLSDETYRKYSA